MKVNEKQFFCTKIFLVRLCGVNKQMQLKLITDGGLGLELQAAELFL